MPDEHDEAPPELSLAGSVVDKAIEYMAGQNVPPIAIASAFLGGAVSLLARTMPDEAIVSAGCFEDSSFAPPQILFWASRKHEWLKVPESTQLLDKQPD